MILQEAIDKAVKTKKMILIECLQKSKELRQTLKAGSLKQKGCALMRDQKKAVLLYVYPPDQCTTQIHRGKKRVLPSFLL